MITRHALFALWRLMARTRLADLMARTIEVSLDCRGETTLLIVKNAA